MPLADAIVEPFTNQTIVANTTILRTLIPLLQQLLLLLLSHREEGI